MFDLGHVRRVDLPGRIVGVEIPRARHADGVEPGVGGGDEHRLGGRRIAPGGLKGVSEVEPIGGHRQRHVRGDRGRERFQIQREGRVEAVARTGGDGAAVHGNHRDLTAGVGVRGHGQCCPAAIVRFDAK